jgi:hypothetical protein
MKQLKYFVQRLAYRLQRWYDFQIRDVSYEGLCRYTDRQLIHYATLLDMYTNDTSYEEWLAEKTNQTRSMLNSTGLCYFAELFMSSYHEDDPVRVNPYSMWSSLDKAKCPATRITNWAFDPRGRTPDRVRMAAGVAGWIREYVAKRGLVGWP